ncbi:casbene synthase, putative [Ricinus communis]|uniref:Casbene synthase, putative n=1 Tax=Ricinus communis TaxID=3988 RepID=B9RY04_RICCO|nr:casbene synthase, putative [Ricinus communis]
METVKVFQNHMKKMVRERESLLAVTCKCGTILYIRNSLLRPYHQGIERLEARQYICFYRKDESCNETLLKFAKLDFNRLQLLYKQELASLSKWWKDLNLAEELPYMRDRLVETYLWAIGNHFEPQYAFSRVMITKYTVMVSAVDDTYDAYGTIDEL